MTEDILDQLWQKWMSLRDEKGEREGCRMLAEVEDAGKEGEAKRKKEREKGRRDETGGVRISKGRGKKWRWEL